MRLYSLQDIFYSHNSPLKYFFQLLNFQVFQGVDQNHKQHHMILHQYDLSIYHLKWNVLFHPRSLGPLQHQGMFGPDQYAHLCHSQDHKVLIQPCPFHKGPDEDLFQAQHFHTNDMYEEKPISIFLF